MVSASGAIRTTPEERHDRALVRWLAVGGVIGPTVYVACFLIAGLVRPGYSPIRQAVSDLGVGPNYWLIEIPGVLNWLLITGFVVAFFRLTRGVMSPFWRWTSAFLLELSPLGFGVASIFTEAPSTLTIHWVIGANLGLIGPIIAFAATGVALRRTSAFRRAGNLALLASGSTLVLVAITFWAFAPSTPLRVAGLMERIVIVQILACYAIGGLNIARLPQLHQRGRVVQQR